MNSYDIFQLLKDQELKAAEKRKAAMEVLKSNIIPTPKEAIAVINSAVSERKSILVNHCYWKENKIREGLEALIKVANTAYVDICRHNAALVAISKGYSDFDEQVSHTVSNPLQKDVMAFCAAAHGCIDTVRRLKKCRPDLQENIDIAISKNFTGPVFEFVKYLRKNLSHGSVVIPSWNITSNKEGRSGSMILFNYELLAFGEWSKSANEYIRNQKGEKTDIANAIEVYNLGLIEFSKEINDMLAHNITDAEKDYYEIEDNYKRWSSGQWYKIFAAQIGKGKNPYDYLHRYFEPEELREILRRPKNSREQVDYIISLRSVKTHCDEELRHYLYKLFDTPAE